MKHYRDIFYYKGFRITPYLDLQLTPAKNWGIKGQLLQGGYNIGIALRGRYVMINIPYNLSKRINLTKSFIWMTGTKSKFKA